MCIRDRSVPVLLAALVLVNVAGTVIVAVFTSGVMADSRTGTIAVKVAELPEVKLSDVLISPSPDAAPHAPSLPPSMAQVQSTLTTFMFAGSKVSVSVAPFISDGPLF